MKWCVDKSGNAVRSGHDWILDEKTQVCNNCGLEIGATKKLIMEVRKWKARLAKEDSQGESKINNKSRRNTAG